MATPIDTPSNAEPKAKVALLSLVRAMARKQARLDVAAVAARNEVGDGKKDAH